MSILYLQLQIFVFDVGLFGNSWYQNCHVDKIVLEELY
jgi:hypothetical protein